MFPSLTCWALQRSHQDRKASFSSHILQTLLRVHPRTSFALFCSTDGICASCFSLQNTAGFILCPSSCFPSLRAWDCLQVECVCFIPSATWEVFNENSDQNQTQDRQRRKHGCFDLPYSWEIHITSPDPGFWRTLCSGLPPRAYLSLGFIPSPPCNPWILFKQI